MANFVLKTAAIVASGLFTASGIQAMAPVADAQRTLGGSSLFEVRACLFGASATIAMVEAVRRSL